MLPLYLLNAVKGETVVVELKNAGIINGTLENCDSYMNVTLTSAYASLSMDEPFHKIDRIYIRGTTIKFFKMGNEFIEKFKEQQQREKDNHSNYRNNNRQYNNHRQNKFNNQRRGNGNYNQNNNGNNRWGNNSREEIDTKN